MPCPYFFPVEHFARWPRPPKLPLGDPHTGFCHADPAGPAEPGEAALKELCNLGYARNGCQRFPRDSPADAVRFMISHDDGARIRVLWARERDHHPYDQGWLDYSLADEAFHAAHADAILQQQAQAYVASYLRRRERARKAS